MLLTIIYINTMAHKVVTVCARSDAVYLISIPVVHIEKT